MIRWLLARAKELGNAKWWYSGKAMAFYALVGLLIGVPNLLPQHEANPIELTEGSSHLESPAPSQPKVSDASPQPSEEDEAESPDGQRFFASYSFRRPPFIHPRILEDMTGQLADRGDQVVAINLLDSQNSNRYFGEVTIEGEDASYPGSSPWVYAYRVNISGPTGDLRKPFYAYQYIGTSSSGIDVLHTKFGTGGVAVRHQIVFITFRRDRGVEYDYWAPESADQRTPNAIRHRELIWLVGRAGLGDRWEGSVVLVNNDVVVRGRNIDERCEQGGISRIDAAQMSLFFPPDCRLEPPDAPPVARVIRVPTD